MDAYPGLFEFKPTELNTYLKLDFLIKTQEIPSTSASLQVSRKKLALKTRNQFSEH